MHPITLPVISVNGPMLQSHGRKRTQKRERQLPFDPKRVVPWNREELLKFKTSVKKKWKDWRLKWEGKIWCHNTQNNDTQHKNIQHIDIQYYDIRYNDVQHNELSITIICVDSG